MMCGCDDGDDDEKVHTHNKHHDDDVAWPRLPCDLSTLAGTDCKKLTMRKAMKTRGLGGPQDLPLLFCPHDEYRNTVFS